jgi:neopullulanase
MRKKKSFSAGRGIHFPMIILALLCLAPFSPGTTGGNESAGNDNTGSDNTAEHFVLSLENSDPSIATPDWVKHAIFYQIFPDRFARSEKHAPPKGITLADWEDKEAIRGFYGGDLWGVAEKLDYLKELGITAVYFNPIFASTTYHRYNTQDYRVVDPLLGGDEALRHLIDEAHKRDIKIILDGVFNHCARGFYPFAHVMDSKERSPYVDWFYIKGWPLRTEAGHTDENPPNYTYWAHATMMPKLNFLNEGVREYFLDVARYWLEFGADGWRLDVATEIEDHTFWQEFRKVVKETNPEAYIIGEKWVEAQPWLQGDQFDAVMNYYTGWTATKFFGRETLRKEFLERRGMHDNVVDGISAMKRMDYLHRLYDPEIIYSLEIFIDSHDTGRALWNMGEDKTALKLTVLFTMTIPGAPTIYYGDEIGLSAGDDPLCRETFPWQDEGSWDKELLEFYRSTTALRHRYPVLRTGSFQSVYADRDVWVFLRKLDAVEVLVAFNAGNSPNTIFVPAGSVESSTFIQIWPEGNEGEWKVKKGQIKLKIPARSAVLMKNHREATPTQGSVP